MTKPAFYEAARVIPWIGLGVLFQGVYLLTSIGLNITKQTRYYPVATIAAARHERRRRTCCWCPRSARWARRGPTPWPTRCSPSSGCTLRSASTRWTTSGAASARVAVRWPRRLRPRARLLVPRPLPPLPSLLLHGGIVVVAYPLVLLVTGVLPARGDRESCAIADAAAAPNARGAPPRRAPNWPARSCRRPSPTRWTTRRRDDRCAGEPGRTVGRVARGRPASPNARMTRLAAPRVCAIFALGFAVFEVGHARRRRLGSRTRVPAPVHARPADRAPPAPGASTHFATPRFAPTSRSTAPGVRGDELGAEAAGRAAHRRPRRLARALGAGDRRDDVLRRYSRGGSTPAPAPAHVRASSTAACRATAPSRNSCSTGTSSRRCEPDLVLVMVFVANDAIEAIDSASKLDAPRPTTWRRQ